jgi:hypothetical protein
MVSEMKREDGHLVGHDLPYIRSLPAKTMSWESEVISRDCCYTLQYACRTTHLGVNHIHSEMVVCVCVCVCLSLTHTRTHTHDPVTGVLCIFQRLSNCGARPRGEGRCWFSGEGASCLYEGHIYFERNMGAT